MLLLFLFVFFILLFIYGMYLLRKGLFLLSGENLKVILIKFTHTPIHAFATGIILTILLQSSSAVMVITIGLIATKLLTFERSIGIILGTNIGTTLTTEIITFDIQAFIPYLAIGGVLLYLLFKNKIKYFGIILFGLATLFTAMGGFDYLATPIKNYDVISQLLTKMNDSNLFSIFVGTAITSIIQSSSATIGMTMSFLTSETLQLQGGIGVMFGANIGTCVTALLACFGATKEARMCAYAHVWLNVLGVALFFPLIPYLANIGPMLASSIDTQLAHITVIFNIVCSLLVLPFVKPFSNFILKTHRHL